MATIDDLLENSERYAAQFAGVAPPAPARKLIVLTCMDARIDLFPMLGLRLPDAHIIRNAGGRMQEALRSIAVSQLYLATEDVMVIHHTECGLVGRTDAEVRNSLAEARGVDPGDVVFHAFADLDESVRDDLAIYDESPLVRHDVQVRGFVYDVNTGVLREVTRQ